MKAPACWPFSSETDWQLWRSHLDHVEVPHVAMLRREADAEIARIKRCREGRWEPNRPPVLVPLRPAPAGTRDGAEREPRCRSPRPG